MPSTDLQRLAVTDIDARRPAFWRGPAELSDDDALVVEPGGVLDLGTWFNAAPVGWWRELLGPGHLRLRVRGRGTLTVWGAGGGRRHVVDSRLLDGTYETHLPRTEGTDWYWLELAAGPDGAMLESVEWASGGGLGRSRGRAGKVTVVVPTYRREQDCLDQVARLSAAGLAETVGHVVVIDQGGSLASAAGAGEVLDAAGDRVVLLEQGNLGGSGGYSRGMVESLRWPEDAVLLLDDDAEIEPEGLRRLHVLSTLVVDPTILGTGLLSAEAPTSLEALAEGVRRRTFAWGPVDGLGDGVDVADGGPDTWSFTAPRDRSEYTAWWGTLLPPGTVARLGLAVPYFLKWDDAEYGLRARAAGMAVATIPGPAVWHPTWAAKGTISSWSSWPLHRNRLATAAAYGAGRGVLLDSLVHQVKHVLSLQYDAAELWNAAIAEAAGGPGWLSEDLTAVRPRAQALIDAAGRPPVPDVVAVPGPPLALVPALRRALTGLRRAARVRGRRGAVALASPAELTWRAALGRDVVLLGAGEGGAALVRDPQRARRLLREALHLHLRTARAWHGLRRDYAAALPEASSRAAWDARFDG
ncbi:glycosyltransferase [Cellulomonas sp. PhB143]|uniref:glycosyltransferase n=1 Tax=Cellulomonas sp. PhB143 TaxID=2485186 RepID=UPI000F48A6F1|nr:glycosyltransferase [Cellulomonas sp. PhB143]ROS78561.1 galactofuranosylgalactofuranosylrhamnosyl-N-acetylglucosaminyl-diphospho-decaprenol beta-1,5/1,6-galactofuranosyltransferase [Cellulomonas sp. PhB143]